MSKSRESNQYYLVIPAPRSGPLVTLLLAVLDERIFDLKSVDYITPHLHVDGEHGLLPLSTMLGDMHFILLA